MFRRECMFTAEENGETKIIAACTGSMSSDNFEITRVFWDSSEGGPDAETD